MGTSVRKSRLKYWILDGKIWRYFENDDGLGKVEMAGGKWWGVGYPRRVPHLGPCPTHLEAMKLVEAFVKSLNCCPNLREKDCDGISKAALRNLPKPPRTLCGLRRSPSGYGFEND